MPRSRRLQRDLLLGCLLALVSIAPAPEEKPKTPSPLAEARFKAATKQFNEVWTFYRQSRTESFPVYLWSRLVLDSERQLSDAKTDRVGAAEAHLKRMQALETLVKKVRRLGFGFSIDVGASEYYRIEAEIWLDQEKSR